MKVIKDVKDNGLLVLTASLVAMFIITLPGYTDMSKKVFYLLALLSLWSLIINFQQLKLLNTQLKILFVCVFLSFVWAAFTFYYNGSPGRGSNFLWGRQVYLLFLIPLYLLFRQVTIPFKVIWLSVVVSVLLASYVGYQDIQVANGRAHGGMHPILFGSIMLCMAAFMLMTVLLKKDLIIKGVSILVAVVALMLVVWTESRGVWAAAPAVLVIIYLSQLKRMAVMWRWLSFVMIVVGVVLVSQHPVVERKLDQTIINVTKYSESKSINDWGRRTSIGTRFEMWKAGWQIFLDNPVIGVGVGGYDGAAKQNADKYQINRSAYWFYHPHNQYISALSTKGIPGFILLMLVLVLPVYYVFSKGKTEVDEFARYMILIVCVAYGVYGLSDVPFEGKATIMFYTVIMSILLATKKTVIKQQSE